MDRQLLACETLAGDRQFNPANRTAVSPALAAAQDKLQRLRLAHRPDHNQRPEPTPVQHGRFQTPNRSQSHQTRPNALPPHLGWHSAPATAAYRRAIGYITPVSDSHASHHPTRPSPPPQPNPNHTDYRPPAINLPPDIALAILRRKLAAPGRIWLLLRHLDKDGRGWLAATEVRRRLTDETSDTAVCGQRQLRNLLAAGEGIFWERDEDRVWLRSMARVAAALGLERLNGRSVKLPLSILLDAIGTVRAHLYATFHSSRTAAADTERGKPISRQTLKALSAATRRTQRLYEKKVGIRPRANYAIGRPHSIEAEQERAWEQGRALFRFHDHKGFIGQSGQQYLAWQLPNSYDGPHDVLSRGHQRQINRQLADLLNEGITGNGEMDGRKPVGEAEDGLKRPLFYRNGAKAAATYNRAPEQDYYWRSRTGRGRFALWHFLPALDQEKPHL